MFIRHVLTETRQALARELRDFSLSSPTARLALAASLSCLLAVLAAIWFDTDRYYWAGISAIVVTRPSLGESLHKGINRLAGTAAGGVLGLACLALFAQNRPAILTVIFFLTAATIWIVSRRGQDSYAFGMAGFSAVMICLGNLTQPESADQAAILRVIEIGIGIGSAWFVGGLLLPTPSAPILRATVRKSLTLARDLVREAVAGHLAGGIDRDRLAVGAERLGTLLAEAEARLFHTRLEQALSEADRLFFRRLQAMLAGVRQAVLNLAHLPCPTPGADFPRLHQEPLEAMAQTFASLVDALKERAKAPSPGETEAAQAAIRTFCHSVDALETAYEQRRHTPEHLGQPAADVLVHRRFLGIFEQLAAALVETTGAGLQSPAAKRVQETAVLRQALAGGLAMVAVPLLWIWLDLPGLSEIAISALIVLQVDEVETVRKGMLRLAGCLLGAATGLALLGVPALAEFPVWLGALLLFLFLFTSLGFGDPRCAYIGLQAAIALIITLVQGNGPADSLAPPLERLAAIAVAIAVMHAIIGLLGPKHPRQRLHEALQQARERLAVVLAALAAQARGEPVKVPEVLDRLDQAVDEAKTALARLTRLEPLAPQNLAALDRRHRLARNLLWHVRALARHLPRCRQVPPQVSRYLDRAAVWLMADAPDNDEPATVWAAVLADIETLRRAETDEAGFTREAKLNLADFSLGLLGLWHDLGEYAAAERTRAEMETGMGGVGEKPPAAKGLCPLESR
jgi:uncharacterized membrane protein YccC